MHRITKHRRMDLIIKITCLFEGHRTIAVEQDTNLKARKLLRYGVEKKLLLHKHAAMMIVSWSIPNAWPSSMRRVSCVLTGSRAMMRPLNVSSPSYLLITRFMRSVNAPTCRQCHNLNIHRNTCTERSYSFMQHQKIFLDWMAQVLTSLSMRMVRSMSSSSGGSSARPRIAFGSPMLSNLALRMRISSGQRCISGGECSSRCSS